MLRVRIQRRPSRRYRQFSQPREPPAFIFNNLVVIGMTGLFDLVYPADMTQEVAAMAYKPLAGFCGCGTLATAATWLAPCRCCGQNIVHTNLFAVLKIQMENEIQMIVGTFS